MDAYLLRERDGLWHNRYALWDLEKAVWDDRRVVSRFWEHLPEGESILHIMLEDARKVDPALVRMRVRGIEREEDEGENV
jgi:hypothetical protein